MTEVHFCGYFNHYYQMVSNFNLNVAEVFLGKKNVCFESWTIAGHPLKGSKQLSLGFNLRIQPN